ncbi:MAG: ATP-binding protein [Pseudomonadota bacterium]
MDRIADYKAVVGALCLPAVIVGQGKRVLVMNAASRELLGHNATGAHYTFILRQPSATAALEQTLSDGAARTARIDLSVGGEPSAFTIDITPLAAEPSPGVLLVFRDVSGEEGLGQMRRDFVANVSHELRTPLTALSGFIETLRGPARGDAAATDRFLGMMEVEAERMRRLVQDLLSLSRVESEARLRPEARVELTEALREAVETVRHAMKDHAAELSLDLPEGEVWINGDRDQLMQVARNLLENAIKYGAGEVEVAMSLPEREPAMRGPAVLLDIRDNGEGIEPHHLPRLTERFYRIDTHRSREQGGTGLGLAIVKHIVSRHRGRLRISSVRGEGSVFTVVLPR